MGNSLTGSGSGSRKGGNEHGPSGAAASSDALRRPPDPVDADDPPGEVEGCGLDPKSSALVRLAALVVQDAGFVSYHWGVQWALAAGATADEIVGTLMAVTPITGITRVVAAAPELALALGYDLDSALESWDGDPD